LVPVTGPGVIVMACEGNAPLPSTRSCPPLNSDRLILIAASALLARRPSVAMISAAMENTRRYRISRPFGSATRGPSLASDHVRGRAPVHPSGLLFLRRRVAHIRRATRSSGSGLLPPRWGDRGRLILRR